MLTANEFGTECLLKLKSPMEKVIFYFNEDYANVLSQLISIEVEFVKPKQQNLILEK